MRWMRYVLCHAVLFLAMTPVAASADPDAAVSASARTLLEKLDRRKFTTATSVSHVEKCALGHLNDCLAEAVRKAKDKALQEGVRRFVADLPEAALEALGLSEDIVNYISAAFDGDPEIRETLLSGVHSARINVRAGVLISVDPALPDLLRRPGRLTDLKDTAGPIAARNTSADRISCSACPEDMVAAGAVCIDRTEVDIASFKMVFPHYTPPNNRYTDAMPVINITFAQAEEFAVKTGRRLCTSDEWLAALGPAPDVDKGILDAGGPGDAPYDAADARDVNPHGLLNMIGNVSEWTVSPDGAPAYVGGHWYFYIEHAADDDASVTAAVSAVRLAGGRNEQNPRIGFRRCMDCRK